MWLLLTTGAIPELILLKKPPGFLELERLISSVLCWLLIISTDYVLHHTADSKVGGIL